MDGLQIGQTGTEDYCLVVSAQRSAQRMIAVVLGAASEGTRAEKATELLDYGFHLFNTYSLYGTEQTLLSPRVWKGTVKHLARGPVHACHIGAPGPRIACGPDPGGYTRTLRIKDPQGTKSGCPALGLQLLSNMTWISKQ